MSVAAIDLEISKHFCDFLGCSEDHLLREALPMLIESVRAAERARCMKIVETEKVLEGEPIDEARSIIIHKMTLGVPGIVEMLRGAVGTTKDCILARMQSKPDLSS